MAGAFYPEALIGQLAQQLPADGSLLIIDSHGDVLYSSDPEAPATVAGAPHLETALAGSGVRLTASATPYGDEFKYGALVPVPSTGWVVSFTRSEAALEAVLRDRLLVKLGAIAALMSLAAIAFALIARDLTRPLARLSGYARQVAQAGLSGPPPTVTGGGVEVEDLAQAMASMSRAVAEREQELRKAIQLRERFLSVASHELRTPLTIMKASVQLMQRRTGEPLVNELAEQVERLNRLIDDLLGVSSLREGQVQLRRDDVDLAELARQVVARFEHSPDRTDGHRLALNVPGSVIGSWDAARLEQVVTNLISNALKYSPDGGTVTVEVRSGAGAAELVVQDEGLGIPEEEQHLLFEPFMRHSTAGHIEGTGLGLYISAEIVRRHGGTIEARSAAGKGSVFTVRLPTG